MVRRIGWMLLLLGAVGWMAAECPVRRTPPSAGGQTEWRRTLDGWERASWLRAEVPVHRPALHPSVVGLLELFLSVGALAVFRQEAAE